MKREILKEKNTNDFRQVQYSYWIHDQFVIYYKIQSKYLVVTEFKEDHSKGEDGFIIWDMNPAWEEEQENGNWDAKNENPPYIFAKVKEEWRFLPEIKEESLEK